MFAGWVGLGMAVVVVIAFGLIIPLQPLVVLAALPIGLIIGWYANVRSERYRPRRRALGNALWAGLVSGVGLAVFYVLIRLIFVYADTGGLPTGARLDCQPGPDCTYQRYVALDRADELAALGIRDGASYEAAVLREMATMGGALIAIAIAGAGVAGGWRAASRPPD